MKTKTFKVPKENWKAIPIQSAKHILELSKERVEFTLEESLRITNRSFSIIILLTSLLSLLIGFTFNRILNNEIIPFDYLNVIYTIIISIQIIMLLTLLLPKKLQVKGHVPRILARKEFLYTSKLTADENYLAYVINSIEHNQTAIDTNSPVNLRRSNTLKTILWSISLMIPAYILLAIILLF